MQSMTDKISGKKAPTEPQPATTAAEG
jgi:hypothetical protein